MALCATEGCPGHLGKFSDCVAEAVYEWSLDPMWDDGQTGDVEFEGHFTLFIVREDDTVFIDPDGDSRTVTVPAGFYILHCTNSGAVDLWTYNTEQEARAEFELHELAYSNWSDDDDPGEGRVEPVADYTYEKGEHVIVFTDDTVRVIFTAEKSYRAPVEFGLDTVKAISKAYKAYKRNQEG